MKILAFSGSLRQGSSNTALLETARALAAPEIAIDIFEGLADLPYFNPDLDHDPLPAAVARFRGDVTAAQALLISTPEYAHGIPGVLKNALDWLVGDPDFAGKPVGILFGSATDGGFAKTALIEVLQTMSARIIPEAVLTVPGVRTKVGPDGNSLDFRMRDDILRVVQFLAGY